LFRGAFRRKVSMNNIGGRPDKRILPLQFFLRDFARRQAPHIRRRVHQANSLPFVFIAKRSCAIVRGRIGRTRTAFSFIICQMGRRRICVVRLPAELVLHVFALRPQGES